MITFQDDLPNPPKAQYLSPFARRVPHFSSLPEGQMLCTHPSLDLLWIADLAWRSSISGNEGRGHLWKGQLWAFYEQRSYFTVKTNRLLKVMNHFLLGFLGCLFFKTRLFFWHVSSFCLSVSWLLLFSFCHFCSALYSLITAWATGRKLAVCGDKRLQMKVMKRQASSSHGSDDPPGEMGLMCNSRYVKMMADKGGGICRVGVAAENDSYPIHIPDL